MAPLLRLMSRARPHQVGLVLLDPHLVDARNRAPEADEIVDLAGVALHPDHLDDDLHGRSALLLQARETDKVVAYFFEAGALAIELEALFRRAVEAERDVLERRREQPLGHFF